MKDDDGSTGAAPSMEHVRAKVADRIRAALRSRRASAPAGRAFFD